MYGMSSSQGSLGKTGSSEAAGAGSGGGEYKQGVVHGRAGLVTNKKPRCETPGFGRAGRSLIIAAKCSEQAQHMDEQVVDAQVQRHCGADVVGFSAVNDAAGIKKNQA